MAEKICKQAITNPLEQRIIDPACGSGTFLFHAIKLIISKSKKENIPSKEIIELICEKIAGIDIHPVAVIFSRVTYLLAMMEQMKDDRPDNISIPVYLGDALQWHNFNHTEDNNNFYISVPKDEQARVSERELVFPKSICQDSDLFQKVLDKMIQLSEHSEENETFEAWLQNENITENNQDCEKLSKTYNDLKNLHQEGRNHIWGFVAGNLTRPIWLSSERQKADVVIGNPPWLKFNSMNSDMQKRFKNECQNFNLHPKKQNLQTSQDLSSYFFVRCVDLYMKENGKIAFVMPYGIINGDHHKNFRNGYFKQDSENAIYIRFEDVWTFNAQVKNLFKLPSCVLFSMRRKENEQPIPQNILSFKGNLPKKNITLREAEKNSYLNEESKQWPLNKYTEPSNYSYYHDKFQQGASLVPRRFIFVEKIKSGKLGHSQSTPRVRGVESNLDKPPWKSIEPIEGQIEKRFLKTVLKGASIAPFRIIKPSQAIIPYDRKVIDASEAGRKGHTHLKDWLRKAEKLWQENSTGQIKIFKENIDYRSKLTNQFPISKLRVVYKASGNNIVAILLKDRSAIIESSLYSWNDCCDENEGIYLTGALNSGYLIDKIRHLQSQGLYGPRHISRLPLKCPIPRWNSNEPLHQEIVHLAKNITNIVEEVRLDNSWGFQKARKEIREKIQSTKEQTQLNQKVKELIEKEEIIRRGKIEQEHAQRIQEKELKKEKLEKFIKD